MNRNAYEAPALTVLGGVEELTAGGQGTGDGTGSLKPDQSGAEFGIAG